MLCCQHRRIAPRPGHAPRGHLRRAGPRRRAEQEGDARDQGCGGGAGRGVRALQRRQRLVRGDAVRHGSRHVRRGGRHGDARKSAAAAARVSKASSLGLGRGPRRRDSGDALGRPSSAASAATRLLETGRARSSHAAPRIVCVFQLRRCTRRRQNADSASCCCCFNCCCCRDSASERHARASGCVGVAASASVRSERDAPRDAHRAHGCAADGARRVLRQQPRRQAVGASVAARRHAGKHAVWHSACYTAPTALLPRGGGVCMRVVCKRTTAAKRRAASGAWRRAMR